MNADGIYQLPLRLAEEHECSHLGTGAAAFSQTVPR